IGPLQESVPDLHVARPSRPMPQAPSAGFDAGGDYEPLEIDRSMAMSHSSAPPSGSPSSMPRGSGRPAQIELDTGSSADGGDWLETGSRGMHSFFSANADREIDRAWLAEIVAQQDVEAFKGEVKALEKPVAALMERGDAAALSAVITTMRSIIKPDPN